MSQGDAEKWDDRYRNGAIANQSPHPLVVRAASLRSAGLALDVACGLGRHALALAAQGWQVTALDASRVALAYLEERAAAQNLKVATACVNLTAESWTPIEQSYDLIVMTNYLQRDLFAPLKLTTRVNGIFVAVIAMVDDDPQVKPMNQDYLLQPGELASYFRGWELIHFNEGKPVAASPRRAMAEIIARRR